MLKPNFKEADGLGISKKFLKVEILIQPPFSSKTEFTLIKAVHDKLKPFKCSDCDFACLKKVDLQIHESQEHQQTTFSCEICGLCFPQKVDLQFHMSGKVISSKVL